MAKYFSAQGFEKYRQIIVGQERVVRSVGQEVGEEAGANCDWHDNFGYEDAKRRLELETRRLSDLLTDIKEAQIITAVEQDSQVAIGSSVRVALGDVERELVIGAFGEADPDKGVISYTAPLAQHILGLRVGDTKNVRIADRLVDLEVLAIRPPSHRYATFLAESVARGSHES